MVRMVDSERLQPRWQESPVRGRRRGRRPELHGVRARHGGSPPVRIGEGRAEAISPDNKWVITQPLQQGPLQVVPTGAGEARQLTHDNVRYTRLRYLPDGKHLLAVGIEAGHGGRDYLIDVSNGNA